MHRWLLQPFISQVVNGVKRLLYRYQRLALRHCLGRDLPRAAAAPPGRSGVGSLAGGSALGPIALRCALGQLRGGCVYHLWCGLPLPRGMRSLDARDAHGWRLRWHGEGARSVTINRDRRRARHHRPEMGSRTGEANNQIFCFLFPSTDPMMHPVQGVETTGRHSISQLYKLYKIARKTPNHNRTRGKIKTTGTDLRITTGRMRERASTTKWFLPLPSA